MSLLNWIRQPLRTRQVAIWSLEVARRCHPDVAIRLGQKMYRMSLPEARGFIRARAAAVLDDEIAFLQQQTHCDALLAAAVHTRAVHELTRLAIGDWLKSKRHTPLLRRAA